MASGGNNLIIFPRINWSSWGHAV